MLQVRSVAEAGRRSWDSDGGQIFTTEAAWFHPSFPIIVYANYFPDHSQGLTEAFVTIRHDYLVKCLNEEKKNGTDFENE